MPIYAIVAAYPVDVDHHELPRVEVRTHVVEGSSLQAAYERVKDHTHVVDATEVVGAELAQLCLSPDSRLRYEEQLAVWQHWTSMVNTEDAGQRWTVLARGPESFQVRIERLFAERYPQLA